MEYMDFPISDKKLGMIYSQKETIFRVYSPARKKIQLALYPHMYEMNRELYNMDRAEDGVYEITIEKDLKGYYYTYIVEDKYEVTDPYSISSSINSNRSAIIDLEDTNPKGFKEHKIPETKNKDAIIYEVHVKDFTFHPSSKVNKRGKFLGFIEKIPHLVELGVTHVQLLPVYDFLTVREEKEYFHNDENYNWGYDPELYNSVEGSYSTNPEDPISRIYELKSLIQALHEAGLKLVLDVVYNHTYRTEDSNFNVLAEKYYHRQYIDGNFADGAGCGNEIASERPMVRKFILDSLKYWVEEFKIDGYRFDLMGLVDIDTVELAIEELRKIRPDIIIYGEPWAAGWTPLSDRKTTSKGKQSKLGFGLFNDNFRDAVKGDNDGKVAGFVQGNQDYKTGTETGIAGSVYYDESHIGFTKTPQESINYLNSHDNLILADKFKKVYTSLDDNGNKRLNKLAHTILFTSQGIPFIHAGNEFLRSKNMVANSYNSPISINQIDWSLKEKHMDLFKYIQGLIRLRKKYDAFTMVHRQEVRDRLKFMHHDDCTIIYTLKYSDDEYLLIGHNANMNNTIITRPDIRNHIIDTYGDEIKHMKLFKLLDIKGYRNIPIQYGLNAIEIDFYSSVVFSIKK